MSVDVNKLKDRFTDKMNDLYNQDVYFVESCVKYPEKYPLKHILNDLQLQIFFEENNKIVLSGKCVKYCDKDSKNIIRLINISDEVGSPDINIVNNYIVDDKWEKTDW